MTFWLFIKETQELGMNLFLQQVTMFYFITAQLYILHIFHINIYICTIDNTHLSDFEKFRISKYAK